MGEPVGMKGTEAAVNWRPWSQAQEAVLKSEAQGRDKKSLKEGLERAGKRSTQGWAVAVIQVGGEAMGLGQGRAAVWLPGSNSQRAGGASASAWRRA